MGVTQVGVVPLIAISYPANVNAWVGQRDETAVNAPATSIEPLDLSHQCASHAGVQGSLLLVQ